MVPSLVPAAPPECVCLCVHGRVWAGVVRSLFMPGPQLAHEVTLVTLSAHWPGVDPHCSRSLLFIHGPVRGAERRSLRVAS